MAKEFEGEVRTVKPKQSKRPRQKDPNLEVPRRDSKKEGEGEQSPLKTAKGTPIIQRTPEA